MTDALKASCLKAIGVISVSAMSQSPTAAVEGGSSSEAAGGKLAQIFELPETVKKEDLKQLKMLLPNASECFIASLLPLQNDIFSSQGPSPQHCQGQPGF